MSKKYKIGEKYLVKIFLEPEEMEYLGKIKTSQLNGGYAGPIFEVFRRYSYIGIFIKNEKE